MLGWDQGSHHLTGNHPPVPPSGNLPSGLKILSGVSITNLEIIWGRPAVWLLTTNKPDHDLLKTISSSGNIIG
jgi:hypothetical protein